MAKFFRKTPFLFLAVFAFVTFFTFPLLAGTYGKIVGTVKDADTGEALPRANVLIVGTTMGASSDTEGRYFIINVPLGTYSLKASFMGYVIVTKTNVKVSIDVTTEVNFELKPTVIKGEAVTVVAERPLIEKTLTQSKSTVGAKELDNALPVAGVTEIVETAASTFHGYIRGGRKYETKTLVDGVDVSDTYFTGGTGAFGMGDVGHNYQGYRTSEVDETATLKVTSSNVQELDVYAGTANAEYPTASAGIVNIVTKTGSNEYHGKFFVRGTPLNKWEHFGSDVYWMKDSQIVAGDTINVGYFDEKKAYENLHTSYGDRAASLYTWTNDLAKDKYYYDPQDSVGLGRSYEMEGTFSGPLPLADGKGNFFFSARYEHMRPTPLPFDVQTHITGNLKILYDFTSEMRLTAYGQIVDGGKLFNFVNWKFNPKWAYNMNCAPRYKDLSSMYYLKFTHTLSPKTFYEVQLSQNNKTDWVGYPDDNGDGKPELNDTGDFIEFKDMAEYTKYVGGYIKTDTLRDEAGNIIGFQNYIPPESCDGYIWADANGDGENDNFADVTKRVFFYDQIDPSSGINESKANFYGVDGWYRTAYPAPLYWKTTRNVTTLKADLTSQITYNHQLKTGLQFRYHNVDIHHLQSPIGGAGYQYPYNLMWPDFGHYFPKEFAYYLQDRVEYKGLIFNVGARVDAYNTDTQKFKNDFHPYDPVYTPGVTKNLLELKPVRGDKVGWKWFFSPRIGVSHPVSDKMAMHYSFGKFIQYPNFASLYEDYSLMYYGYSTIYTKWVNQEPMRSTAYEMGLQYAPLTYLVCDVSVYYRDVENYSKIRYTLTPVDKIRSIGWDAAWGHADARGIELTVQKRPGKWWAGRLTYAYSYIKAAVPKASVEESQRRSYASAVDSAKFAELPWERIDEINYREENVAGGYNTGLRTGNALVGGYDRTHRFAASLMGFLPYGVQLSTVAEVASGFKYWPYENIENDPFFDVSPKLQEGPWTWWINLRVTKELALGAFRARVFGEVRNLTNHENIMAINNTPFMEKRDQIIFELGRDMKPGTGDEKKDPQGIRRVPHDTLGRLLYGPARQFWTGLEFSL